MRRFLDLIVAVCWLTVTVPLLILIAVAIKLSSPGPIFYTPTMIGQRGKPFRLWRFRTMHIGHATRRAGGKYPAVGRLIRSCSLDHLPTLINLLKGDLTLVGPRPMEPDVVDMGELAWQRYFETKPGLFNYAVLRLGRLWTPTRESNPSLNQELEWIYAQQRSLLSDARLILKGLRAYIASRGNVKARGKPDEEPGANIP